VAAALAIALPAAVLALRAAGIPQFGFDAVLPHVAGVAAAATGLLVLAGRAGGFGPAALAVLGAGPTLSAAAWLDGRSLASIATAWGAVACAAATSRGLAQALPGAAAGLLVAILFGGPAFLLEAARIVNPRGEPPVLLVEAAGLSPVTAAVRGEPRDLALCAAVAIVAAAAALAASRRTA
jgi:hypothetical protein